MSVLSIDVGIKNLALCLLKLVENPADSSQRLIDITYWDVLNLCGEAVPCSKEGCQRSATLKTPHTTEQPSVNVCGIHAKTTGFIVPPPLCLNDKKLKALKKIQLISLCEKYLNMPAAELNALKKEQIFAKVDELSKTKMLQGLSQVAANDLDLVSLGIELQKRLDEVIYPLIQNGQVAEVIIENQISPIANRMKSIQGMLSQYFIMRGQPNVKFVSAANKLRGLTEDTETYSDRKKAGIAIATDLIQRFAAAKWLTMFQSHKKKDDLADCMLQGYAYIKMHRLEPDIDST